MPHIVIHVSNVMDDGTKAAFVQRTRETIPAVLKLDPISGHVILYESPARHRSTFAERDPNFVFFEVFMHPGHPPEAKRELIDRVTHLIYQVTGVDPKNIHAVIHEIPPENYFGGILHRH